MATPTLVRVSVSEAARLFGINSRTIRRALAAGELTYIVVRGRYKINFESLVRWSQQKPAVGKKRDAAGIGQYVEHWRIRNTLYSPNPRMLGEEKEEAKKT
ncbi:helix-turn-helix domain-containing protein [Candidatus Uhrbacteria bacterium]|nr:helix-turn-helix domain-containing protein [Candidatus Uhrbacteria bacterium]